jgi:hypothetical protein
MEYICKECNYATKIKRDFEKHKLTNKHVQNTKKIYICKNCNISFQARTTCYLHRKQCINTSSDKLNNDYNCENDLKKELIKTKKELENEKIKNEYERLKLKSEYDNQQIELLKTLLQNSNKTTEKALKITDKTISAIKYANEHFKNAPTLEPINNFNMLDYDLTNDEDKKLLIETLLYHYRKNSVHKVFGDHIVSVYKKDKLEDQSMHTTDTSRMNYIIKISKDDNDDAQWYTDKSGVVICDVIIEKLINHYVDLLKWYQKKLTDEMALNPGIIFQDKQKKVENILGMLMDVDNGQLVKNTNKYIAPFFNLDK